MSNAHNIESFRAIVLASLPAELRSRFCAQTLPGVVVLDAKAVESYRILEDVRATERALNALGFNCYRVAARVEVLTAPKPVEERCDGCGAPHPYSCVCCDDGAE